MAETIIHTQVVTPTKPCWAVFLDDDNVTPFVKPVFYFVVTGSVDDDFPDNEPIFDFAPYCLYSDGLENVSEFGNYLGLSEREMVEPEHWQDEIGYCVRRRNRQIDGGKING